MAWVMALADRRCSGKVRNLVISASSSIVVSGVCGSAGAATDAPSVSGMFVADVLGSHFLVEGILLALRQRDRTGEGQEVHVSLLGAMLEAQGGDPAYSPHTGPRPRSGQSPPPNRLTCSPMLHHAHRQR